MTATTAAPPIHDLLLALAGRLDDDLLAWARELLAVGEEDQAVELATAALAAERVALPPTLRAALVAAARAAHADLDAESALAQGSVEEGTRHRFDAAAAPDDAVVAVLTALPARRLAGCTLHLTWRRTPAGAAPGPLPRAVVLVEADPERSVDVLAYLLATELDRAGAPASVEVFTAGRPLPAYHTAALRSARPVVRGTVERPQAPAEERPSPTPGRHQTADATPLFLVSDAPSEAAGPAAVSSDPRSGDLFGPHATSLDAPPEPPRPAGRRRRPEPADGAPSDDGVAPASPAAPGTRPSPRADVPSTPRAPDTDEPAPDTDPFNGPLQIPLLAPLLEPTGVDPGEPGAGPVAAAPERAAPAEGGADGGGGEQATPAEPGSPPAPAAPAGPAAVPAEWEEDWRSGEWAMPRTPRTAPAPDRPGPDAFDAFAAPGRPEPAAPDLPRRVERTERLAQRSAADAPGTVPPAEFGGAPSAGPDGASLFESPTSRVTPGPRPTPPNGGGHAPPPPDTGRRPGTENPMFPGRPDGGPAPFALPGRAPGDRPGDDPLFGSGPPDVPLFGGAPGPNGRPPEPAAPEEPRPGRRRRPEQPPPAPFSAMDAPLTGHVPAPSRPGDDPEPPALLHGTEGDLLAQLQAELAAREQRPRPYRRGGRNGSAHPVNGHGPDGDRPPPDLAS